MRKYTTMLCYATPLLLQLRQQHFAAFVCFPRVGERDSRGRKLVGEWEHHLQRTPAPARNKQSGTVPHRVYRTVSYDSVSYRRLLHRTVYRTVISYTRETQSTVRHRKYRIVSYRRMLYRTVYRTVYAIREIATRCSGLPVGRGECRLDILGTSP